LSAKPEIVAINKIDAIPKGALAKKRAALEKACKHEVHAISGVSGAGVPTVLRALAKEIQKRRGQKKPVKAVTAVKRKKKEKWAP
jgi:GTPase